MIVRIGAKGPHVKEIQRALDRSGHWPEGQKFTQFFGKVTDAAVRAYQQSRDIVIDGRVGPATLGLLGINIKAPTKFDEKYKGVTIPGSIFPDKPVKNNLRIRLNAEMKTEYLPALALALSGESKGMHLLCTIMAYKEGFRRGTRSYRHHNPGNIGNTDSGANKTLKSLEHGILLQRDYINRIIKGEHSAYPMGRKKTIAPYYSPEIAKHSKLYGMSPFVPGYEFTFTGQINQFVKIYSTGARAGNGYISMIISYFKLNGITINETTTLQTIVDIK